MTDQSTASQTIYRADYTPPAFLVESVDLSVDIQAEFTLVHATLALSRNPAGQGGPLVLDGGDLDTRSIAIDGHVLALDTVTFGDETLTIATLPDGPFTLSTTVAIAPDANTELSGLYRSGDMLCTQCEAQGFRRITWFPDRPDVMARYRVTIESERARYPVLLSNGNCVASVDLGNGRHRAVWEDPFPKPSYLFAVVAGTLAGVRGQFTTRSGRDVALHFWVEPGNESKVPHALESLRKAMKWDEDVFGLEYDLDVYNIVAVSHFNMGAMENKSLNVFNSKYVLADSDTATDGDFLAVESVIAHEYFHNWTGNRVTCRDWFQLTLKEGLTVFRDQEFSADLNSRGQQRIEDVRALRGSQFPEDNGPMAHPIRPDSYVEINNFYTATVYEKGSEVIRMIHTLLGADNFRRGMDLYFERHDGHAVTCEDFVAAMEDASGISLVPFRRWYSQPGTPRLAAAWNFDAEARRLSLTLRQHIPGHDGAPPLHIPVRLGLVGKTGDLPLRLEGENTATGTTRVVSLTEAEQTFVFEDVAEPAIPSLLRGFSAPVILEAPYGQADLAFLMANESDSFNRWEAGQSLASRTVLDLVGGGKTLDEGFAAAWGRVLADAETDPAFAAEAMTLPSTTELGEKMAVFDVDGLHAARKFVWRELTNRFQVPLLTMRDKLAETGYSLTPAAIGRRRVRNLALAVLAEAGQGRALAEAQFAEATCMTDKLSALSALIALGADAAEPALDAFLTRWRGTGLVVNKWLALQAMADWDDVLDRVRALLTHPAFDASEPNKIYALIGGFAGNLKQFHRPDGAGYAFLADQVIALNASNPQVAARMVRPLIRWKRFDANRQSLMKEQLTRIAGQSGLSRDVGEIVSKALLS
jgi:aminopeptidase N